MGFIIMFFHSRALTVGMTKNGEISRMRTSPRPASGSLISKAISVPATTVIPITLLSSTMVFHTAAPNDGSVRKYSKFSSPIKADSFGCSRLNWISEK